MPSASGPVPRAELGPRASEALPSSSWVHRARVELQQRRPLRPVPTPPHSVPLQLAQNPPCRCTDGLICLNSRCGFVASCAVEVISFAPKVLVNEANFCPVLQNGSYQSFSKGFSKLQ